MIYVTGLKVGHTCWPTDPRNNPDLTHLHVTHMLKFFIVIWHEKFLIWNSAIDFFILGRIQNQSLAQTSWRWNLWTSHALKQLQIISWFHTMIFQCIHQTRSSLTYQMPTLFSEEHMIFGSHPDNLVCRWDPIDLMTQVTQIVRVIQPWSIKDHPKGKSATRWIMLLNYRPSLGLFSVFKSYKW